VKIAGHALVPFRLPLVSPLATAHGRVTVREGVVLSLVDADGHTGLGEAAPLPGFGLEGLARARAVLEAAARRLAGCEHADLDAALDAAGRATADAPAARAALDTALHDLAARRAGRSVAAALAAGLGRAPRERVAVAALVRAADPARAAAEAQRAVRAGHRALKLKLPGAADDRERVAAVRAVCPPEVELRLDANGAWSEAQACAHLAALARFAPAFVEQPVAAGDPAVLARVRAASPVPVAADEALALPDGARRVLEAGAADLLVLKPAIVGGLRAALRIAAHAREAGVPVVVGGFLDAAVGTVAALALAAALPDARPAGLDRVLARDLAPLPAPEDGARALPRGPGLGVRAVPDGGVRAVPDGGVRLPPRPGDTAS